MLGTPSISALAPVPSLAAAKTVTRTPMPIVEPSCWNTLTRPEAAPASWLSTPCIAAWVSGVKARPMPPPTSSIGSAIPVQ